MSDLPLADSKVGSNRMEDQKSRSRLRLWRKVKHRNRHRNADCSESISPPNDSYWELEHFTSRDITEEKIVIEGIITIGNSAFPSSALKPRGSIRIWNLKDFFLCSSRSSCSEKVRDERLPFLSYAKLYTSSPPDKEKKRASSAAEKLTHKKKTVNKTGYISSPNRKGVPVSAHELHYIANRAQAEELRRKTFLPYRQDVLACVGFPSPSRQGRIFQPLY